MGALLFKKVILLAFFVEELCLEVLLKGLSIGDIASFVRAEVAPPLTFRKRR